MLNDTPQARKLIQYLATVEAQQIWAGIRGSGAFSVNKKVKHPEEVSQRIADTLTSADTTLCYDASDLMPASIRNAFNRAVLEYLSDPNQLDSLLNRLDQIRNNVASEEWTTFLPC
ncbi:MAG: carbohydrate ABC transporter substrate-binding protein, partial [Pseudonocardiaceae bacterium]